MRRRRPHVPKIVATQSSSSPPLPTKVATCLLTFPSPVLQRLPRTRYLSTDQPLRTRPRRRFRSLFPPRRVLVIPSLLLHLHLLQILQPLQSRQCSLPLISNIILISLLRTNIHLLRRDIAVDFLLLRVPPPSISVKHSVPRRFIPSSSVCFPEPDSPESSEERVGVYSVRTEEGGVGEESEGPDA